MAAAVQLGRNVAAVSFASGMACLGNEAKCTSDIPTVQTHSMPAHHGNCEPAAKSRHLGTFDWSFGIVDHPGTPSKVGSKKNQ